MSGPNYIEKLTYIIDKLDMKPSMLAAILGITEKTLYNPESYLAGPRISKTYDLITTAVAMDITENYFGLLDNTFFDPTNDEGAPNMLRFINDETVAIPTYEWYNAVQTAIHIYKLELKVLSLEQMVKREGP